MLFVSKPIAAGKGGGDFYGGVVSDGTGRRLAGAQALVISAHEARYAFTADNGLFLITGLEAHDLSYLVVAATGHRSELRRLPKQSFGMLDEIQLELATPTPSKTIQKVMPAMPSGWGAAWSNYYELCSDPLREGEEIASSRFWLQGDRACGAWSECKETLHTPTRTCWQFRTQGHSERLFSDAVGHTGAVLELSVRASDPNDASNPAAGIAFVIAADQLGPDRVAALAGALRRHGMRVIPPVLVPVHFRNLVRVFRRADLAIAKRIAADTSVTGGQDMRIDVDDEVAVPAGTVQVWLGGGSK